MLAIVGFQLTARLRPEEPKREAAVSSAVSPKAVPKPVEEAAPIAWLEEKPRSSKLELATRRARPGIARLSR